MLNKYQIYKMTNIATTNVIIGSNLTVNELITAESANITTTLTAELVTATNININNNLEVDTINSNNIISNIITYTTLTGTSSSTIWIGDQLELQNSTGEIIVTPQEINFSISSPIVTFSMGNSDGIFYLYNDNTSSNVLTVDYTDNTVQILNSLSVDTLNVDTDIYVNTLTVNSLLTSDNITVNSLTADNLTVTNTLTSDNLTVNNQLNTNNLSITGLFSMTGNFAEDHADTLTPSGTITVGTTGTFFALQLISTEYYKKVFITVESLVIDEGCSAFVLFPTQFSTTFSIVYNNLSGFSTFKQYSIYPYQGVASPTATATTTYTGFMIVDGF